MTEPEQPELLREQIEQTRKELGETVEALSAKTDVKAHAKDALERTRSSVAKPLPFATAGAVVTGVVVWRVVSHRRAERRRPLTRQERVQRVLVEARERLR